MTIGTAFLRHSIYEYNQRDAEGQWRATLDEVTDVTGDVFLGLSVQCSHCHDHKFDPILQKDYYRLQAFFGNITWAEDKVLANAEEKRQHAEQMKVWEAATMEPRKVIDSIIEPKVASAQKNAMEKFPEEVQVMWRKPREQALRMKSRSYSSPGVRPSTSATGTRPGITQCFGSSGQNTSERRSE